MTPDVLVRSPARVLACAAAALTLVASAAADDSPIDIAQQPGRLLIAIAGKPFATYVYADEDIPRPYFCSVHAPGGEQVTRNHPPQEGADATDHAAFHPGIWLAFGDINGADSWRNKATIEHVEFVQRPAETGESATFTVRNRYRSGMAPVAGKPEQSGNTTICSEVCRHTVLVRPAGYLLLFDSQFTGETEFAFGDQEEMGLGVRVASPLRVEGGSGRLLNSDGRKNEAEVWGQQADWCDYSGTMGEHRVGVTVMPDPANFRRSWFHARDYGFFAANPFGQNAFTRGEKSRVVVRPGEPFRLRFGVLLHSSPAGAPTDLAAAYRDFLEVLKSLAP